MSPPIELPLLAAVGLDAAVWAVWGTAVGLTAARVPARHFERDSWLTRLRSFEADGSVYERIGVKRWKDRLPEAGEWFGGMSKRRLPGRTRADLEDFAAEGRRAELVHWVVPLALAVMLLWNPPLLMLAMVLYAVAANSPCVVVQRYNRARLQRVLSREGAYEPAAKEV